MKRIIGILFALCILLGIQPSAADAANWQAVYVTNTYQYQVDVDSVQKLGGEQYRVTERGVKNDGTVLSQAVCEYKAEQDAPLTYYGKSRTLSVLKDGKMVETNSTSFEPVYPWNKLRACTLAALNNAYGSKIVKAPQWESFYQDAQCECFMDMSSIVKQGDVYGAWVQVYLPALKKEGKYPYVNTRMEYKQDAGGTLFVRSLYEMADGGVNDTPTPWERADEAIVYPHAETEFENILMFLGE